MSSGDWKSETGERRRTVRGRDSSYKGAGLPRFSNSTSTNVWGRNSGASSPSFVLQHFLLSEAKLAGSQPLLPSSPISSIYACFPPLRRMLSRRNAYLFLRNMADIQYSDADEGLSQVSARTRRGHLLERQRSGTLVAYQGSLSPTTTSESHNFARSGLNGIPDFKASSFEISTLRKKDQLGLVPICYLLHIKSPDPRSNSRAPLNNITSTPDSLRLGH
ncbi:hypothetical protein CVT26_012845 [Gymnopilus dilepis]|uniref:Uncharacterized protein n=1 Tax=Gymnopilus dilepis TaxID=231916 RepID=A0A409X0B5_9AGAR|nr:hypothetical protein CVT26_012845 [Gymnopilus dilepis]